MQNKLLMRSKRAGRGVFIMPRAGDDLPADNYNDTCWILLLKYCKSHRAKGGVVDGRDLND